MKIPRDNIIPTKDKTHQTGSGIFPTANWIVSLLRKITQTGVEPIPADGEMKLPPGEIILTKENIQKKERELVKPRGEMVPPQGKENFYFEKIN